MGNQVNTAPVVQSVYQLTVLRNISKPLAFQYVVLKRTICPLSNVTVSRGTPNVYKYLSRIILYFRQVIKKCIGSSFPHASVHVYPGDSKRVCMYK